MGDPKFRQRNLAFGPADGTAAEQAGLRRHGVLGGVQRTIIRHGNGLRVVTQNRSGLSEGGRRGAQKTESEDCGFHEIDPVRGKLLNM